MSNLRKLDVNGIKVFIANPKAIDQETLAMAQAMYSRTHKSIEERLPELFEADSESESEKEAKLKGALSEYYIGYGHKSIGDCGNVTIFFEGVSHLFAKAVEDDNLFRGQETSTRYIDYTDQRCTAGVLEVQELANKWLDFYSKWFPRVLQGVMIANPYQQPPELQGKEIGDVKHQRIWANTCKAKAFDIMRGYLPPGSTTNVAWTGSLRVVSEKLEELLSHPLDEVAEVARELLTNLSQLMPSAFGLPNLQYVKENAHAYSSRSVEGVQPDSRLHFSVLASTAEKASMHNVLATRSRGQAVPRIYDGLATCELIGRLDFGSFRDIQRHRALAIPMPLLVPGDLHPWYTQQVTSYLNTNELVEFAAELDALQTELFGLIGTVDDVDLQYAVPMATLVPVFAAGPLSKMIYMLEMRSGKTVHATLRMFSHQHADMLNDQLGSVVVRCDNSEIDQLHLVRGKQTIAKDL
jgi:thymidylate synthase ThyX